MYCVLVERSQMYLLDGELLPEAASLLDPEHGGGEGARQRVLAYQAQARCLHARFSRLRGGQFSLRALCSGQDKEIKEEIIGREKGNERDKKKHAVRCTVYRPTHVVSVFCRACYRSNLR